MKSNHSSILGFTMLMLVATSIIALFSYAVTQDYFSNRPTLREETQEKLDDIDARLAKIKSKRPATSALSWLTDDEKNHLWWKIANVATKTGSDDANRTTWSLDRTDAMPVAKEYMVSVPNLFDFFKSNRDAKWRTEKAPKDLYPKAKKQDSRRRINRGN